MQAQPSPHFGWKGMGGRLLVAWARATPSLPTRQEFAETGESARLLRTAFRGHPALSGLITANPVSVARTVKILRPG